MNTTSKDYIAQQVKVKRLKLKLTQEEVAKMAGVSTMSVIRLESCQWLNEKPLLAICEALEMKNLKLKE